ncbi:MAG: DNA translocase FtsK [Faecalibacterium prausnitzii]
MFKQAVEVVIDAGQASTSLLQRRCKLGYARAARIMDEMEAKGIIGPYEGAKPRAVAHQPPAVAGNADESTG